MGGGGRREEGGKEGRSKEGREGGREGGREEEGRMPVNIGHTKFDNDAVTSRCRVCPQGNTPPCNGKYRMAAAP